MRRLMPRRATTHFALAAAAALTVAAASASGQNLDHTAPRLPPAAPPAQLPPATRPAAGEDEDAMILPELLGVRLDAPGGEPTVLSDLDAAGRTELAEDLRRRLRAAVGKPLTMRAVRNLAAEVADAYADAGYPVVDVSVPEQDVTPGVLRLSVREGRLGRVRTEGDSYWREDALTRHVRLAPGDLLGRDRLLADVDYVNRNPFRRVGLLLEAGDDAGQSDVVLDVDEGSFPLRVYGGYEDTGTDATDTDRLLAGFNWGDAFLLQRGDLLSYQYTQAAEDPDLFFAHSGSYTASLPWRHEVSALGFYSESRPDMADPNLESDGQSYQASLGYGMVLPRARGGRLGHDLRFGLDYKRTNNNLSFGGEEVFASATEVVQATARYDARLADSRGVSTVALTGTFSPGGVTGRNDDEAFDVARQGADATYIVGRLEVGREVYFGRADANGALTRDRSFVLSARGAAQAASGPLLPSEQLGAGGYGSVRGYDERFLNGDAGAAGTLELFSPAVGVLDAVTRDRAGDALRLVAFYDYATLVNYGESDDPGTISSAGLGVRYNVGDVLSVRYDYGFQLIDGPADGRDGRGHLSVVLSWTF